MFKFSKFFADIIVVCGFIIFLAGILVLLGKGALFAGVFGTGPAVMASAFSTIAISTAGAVFIVGFLIIGFGQLINLLAVIAENLQNTH